MSCDMRQFIQEALDDEHVVRRADAAPPVQLDRGIVPDPIDPNSRKRIGTVPGPVDRILVELSFRPTAFVEVASDRSRCGAMGPDREPALLVQARCESFEIAGAEAIVPYILLARPNDLQRVGNLLGKTNGLL